MHSDIEALEVVCQYYRRHYEEAELRRLKNVTRRLHREILRLQCELGILSKGGFCLEYGCVLMITGGSAMTSIGI